MKKIFCVFCILFACVMGLVACTPELDDIKKTLQDNDYMVLEMQADIYAPAHGLDKSDIDYFYYAKSKDNSSKMYIISFFDKDKAKEFCEAQISKNPYANFHAAQKGTVVFFGSKDAVNLFLNKREKV